MNSKSKNVIFCLCCHQTQIKAHLFIAVIHGDMQPILITDGHLAIEPVQNMHSGMDAYRDLRIIKCLVSYNIYPYGEQLYVPPT